MGYRGEKLRKCFQRKKANRDNIYSRGGYMVLIITQHDRQKTFINALIDQICF